MINFLDAEGKPKWQQYAYIINFDTNKIDYYYMNGQLLESREFVDVDRPFPEAEEILRPPSQNSPTGAVPPSSSSSNSSGSATSSTAKFSLISNHWNYLKNFVLVTYFCSFHNGAPSLLGTKLSDNSLRVPSQPLLSFKSPGIQKNLFRNNFKSLNLFYPRFKVIL